MSGLRTHRLLLLGVAGVAMTASVTAAALVSLTEVSAINRELVQVNRALRFHQDADMMHDALRADVARAQLAGSGQAGVAGAVVRRETRLHAAQYRENLAATASLPLPPRLQTSLRRLRPSQLTYVATAESMVASALAQRGSAPARASYEAAFQQLVPAHAELTERLVSTSAQVERAAAAEKTRAERVIGLATLAAVTGWLVLVAWHRRSTRRLQAALVREAEQRAVAEVLQQSLLPTQLPAVAGVRLAARSVPGQAGQRVGGDWYDVIALPTGHVGLVVGDAVGHDLPAAAVMGQLRNALRAYALEDPEPASVLARINRTAALLDVADLATCICAVLDPSTLQLRWSSAGHLPPLVSSARGPGRLLHGEPGPPLGVTAEVEYPHHEVQLEPGDAMLLYSDGLVERRGTPIDQRLTTLTAVPIAGTGPEVMCDRLLAALPPDESSHADDVTLLLLHVNPDTAVRSTARSTTPVGV